nr:helix-turn-helix domain-containing protein [Nocardioidaceae bacterium]
MTAAGPERAPRAAGSNGGVQSIARAFDVLERMVDAGGEITLTELANSSGVPLSTIHRVMRTLVE